MLHRVELEAGATLRGDAIVATVDVVVRVHPFALPTTLALKTAFDLSQIFHTPDTSAIFLGEEERVTGRW